MEVQFVDNSVKTRLIIAGIKEIEERGIKDFSLRRVALSAQVSCAAPYRHFKDKEDLISEIIKYISSKWELLCKEIERVFKDDGRKLVIELAVANLRFWIANPNYRSVLLTVSAEGQEGLSVFDASLMRAVEDYCRGECEMEKYVVRALIYGSLMMIGEDGDRNVLVDCLRRKLEVEFF